MLPLTKQQEFGHHEVDCCHLVSALLVGPATAFAPGTVSHHVLDLGGFDVVTTKILFVIENPCVVSLLEKKES